MFLPQRATNHLQTAGEIYRKPQLWVQAASQDNTDDQQHLVSQAIQSSSQSGDRLAHKREDKAQMTRQENVCLFSVPAFTVSVLFPA